MNLPPCGLYKTLAAIGSIPEGRLVYFHNHGDPGPGLYLPKSWEGNRVQLQPRGQTLQDLTLVHMLQPLPAEGFYRVTEAFHCCERQCRLFETDALVQLGYDAQARALLFSPEIAHGMLAVPQTGTPIDASRMAHLKYLKVPISTSDPVAMH